MDQRLNYKKHTQNQLNKATGQRVTLYPLINRNSRLSLATKKLIYTSYLRPILTYASAAWAFHKTNRQRLQVFQNRTLRLITNPGRFVRNTTIHRDLKIPTIKEFMTHDATNLYTRAQGSRHTLLRNLGDYSAEIRHIHKRPKHLIDDA